MPLLVRRLCAALVLACVLVSGRAGSEPLPVTLQADLLVKLAGYDRNMRARAGSQLRIVLVTRSSDDDARWAAQMRAVLAHSERIAGLPHAESTVRFTRADKLAATCKAEQIAIVVLSPSLIGEGEHIRTAFDDADVLTVAPSQELVKHGVVLGFELVSGKPKLFFNLPQAIRQHVAISAEVLKLMTVYQ